MRVVYVDSDVVISSLLSQKGAAFLLLENKSADFVISEISELEILEVGRRLNISKESVKRAISKFRKIVSPDTKQFEKYVFDLDDAFIIAGAVKAKAKFLITYNTRHYLIDKIKNNFGVIIMTPALFLQYLRSQQ